MLFCQDGTPGHPTELSCRVLPALSSLVCWHCCCRSSLQTEEAQGIGPSTSKWSFVLFKCSNSAQHQLGPCQLALTPLTAGHSLDHCPWVVGIRVTAWLWRKNIWLDAGPAVPLIPRTREALLHFISQDKCSPCALSSAHSSPIINTSLNEFWKGVRPPAQMLIPSHLHKREHARVWADLNCPEKSGRDSCAVEWSQLERKGFHSTGCAPSQKSHVGSVTENQTPSPVLPQVLCENKRPPSRLENSYFKVEFCALGKNIPKWKSSISFGTAEEKSTESSTGKQSEGKHSKSWPSEQHTTWVQASHQFSLRQLQIRVECHREAGLKMSLLGHLVDPSRPPAGSHLACF